MTRKLVEPCDDSVPPKKKPTVKEPQTRKRPRSSSHKCGDIKSKRAEQTTVDSINCEITAVVGPRT